MLITVLPNKMNVQAEEDAFKETENSIEEDVFINQPGGSTKWRITGKLGSLDEWNLSNDNTVMSHLVGEYYAISKVLEAGDYEFKFTKNGSWDGSVGSMIDNGGGNYNFKFSLTEDTKVNFYINDDLDGNVTNFHDKFRTNLSGLESQGIKQYIPTRDRSLWPRLVGDLQTQLGDINNWSPSDAKSLFVDYYFNNTVYKLQRTFPKGKFECKVVLGSSWENENYGGSEGNLGLNLIDHSADVTFTTDVSKDKKELKHNYKPQDSTYDGAINKSKLYFDSRNITFKKPFGAIKQGLENVTFRFETEANDAQLVKLELTDGSDLSKSFTMFVATVLDGKDYWEVTIPKEEFDSIGVWGYKFIIIDGGTKVEYGDDTSNGGTGAYSDEGQTPYNLTVYASDYKTPDWMKNAVVYQIFPDRFYDGDTENNRAKDKDGYRGQANLDGSISYHRLQYFDGLSGSEGIWSDYPENPRQSEEANKPYYPTAKTDGQWSNEFYGGDIVGISKKLSYLQTLGVTAIYLNPVSWAASNHKYDATDYKHLDPMFGKAIYHTPGVESSGLNYEETRKESDKVYEAFAKSCDQLGIKLIVDGVFNHVGDDSIYFDRYEKYPEIGAYEYWNKVWNEVEKTIPLNFEDAKKQYSTEVSYDAALGMAKDIAQQKIKDYYKALINKATKTNYTDKDFDYINWFEVGPGKVMDEITGKFSHYEYDAWWGYDSLPAVATVTEENTNLSNDKHATIAGAHEYNNVSFREEVIGYDITNKMGQDASDAMQKANAQRWLWMGSSGWRLDVAPDVSDDTWRQFRTSVKSTEGKADVNGKIIDNPVILGEEWGVATDYLLGDMFDSVMNYQFRAAIQNFIVNDGDAKNLDTALEVIRENYPKEAWEAMLNLVDSHDTVRNITKIDNPSWEEENTKIAPEASEEAKRLQALTAIFQMSYPGAPTIYYGDEVAVTGTKDPDSRRTFPWERVTKNVDGTYVANGEYADLFNAYVKAADVRNKYKDLFATGEIKTAYANDSVIAYGRKSSTKGGLSLINKSNVEVTITADVSEFLPDGLLLRDELMTQTTALVENGKVLVTVPAYSGLMMVSTNDITALPEAPSGVVATSSEGESPFVELSWNLVEGVTGYNVYRTLLEGTETIKLTETPVTELTFKDTSVTNGTRYYYYIKTVKGSAISVFSESTSALPSYKITNISQPSSITPMTIGVGKKTEEIAVDITIPGLTDKDVSVGNDVPGLTITLAYYIGDKETSKGVKLRYKEDVAAVSGGAIIAKRFTGSFEPTEAGTYQYYAKATVNNGYTNTQSDETTMEAHASTDDSNAPDAPVLLQPIQESNRVTLNWIQEDQDVSGYDLYRRTNGGVEIKIDTLEASKNSYIDYMVSNNTEYTYRVAAFDQAYNRSYSQLMKVTPTITMVEVTIRLAIPEKVFTSATDNIYIAGDVNGWNQAGWLMKKPSGATDNNIVEYTFKMMSGKKIEYKYTRGTWAKEALTSSVKNDVISPGNYGYSSTDTNIKLTIMNQGGNKMLIEDTVLRWVDMPMMITVPRISYQGEGIAYNTVDASFNLQVSVPFGGIFTINGIDINSIKEGALDQYGNVRLDNIPLVMGLNVFTLKTEPTDTTKAQPWLTDTGRINSQMTATTKLNITRTESEVLPTPTPTPTPIPTPTPTPTPIPTPTPAISKEPNIVGKDGASGWNVISKEIKESSSENENNGIKSTKIEIKMNGSTAIPITIIKELKGKNIDLILDMGEYTWTINGKTVSNIENSIDEYNLNINERTDSIFDEKLEAILIKQLKDSGIKKINRIKGFELAHNGEFPFSATLKLKVDKKNKGKYVFLSYLNEDTQKIEVKGYSKVSEKDEVELGFDHASSYLLSLENPILATVIKSKTIYEGSTFNLKIANGLGQDKITYKTSKKSVATISKNGKITAKKAGTATITTKVVQAGKSKSYKTKIIIKKQKITLTSKQTSLKVGKEFTFIAKGYGLTEGIIWSTSNKKIGTISKTGKLTAKGKGTVYVYAKANGKSVNCKVNIK